MTSQYTAPADRIEIGARIEALMPRAIEELAELVAIPSIADERIVDPAECVRAAEWVREAFRAEGIPAELELTPDGTYAVIGHRPAPAGAPTVLLYCHYDVQPILDEHEWLSPPFQLTERDGRLFGRGAADCKGNVLAHLTALRALRDQTPADSDDAYPVGLILVAEGSEEQGRASLDQYAIANPELFQKADVILIQDAGNAAYGLPTLSVSLRGAVDIEVRVEALKASVHSGMFGGPATDPIAALVRMLATLRDEHGNTTVPGIRADQVWQGLQYEEEAYRADAGLLEGSQILGSGTVSDQICARPVITILGIDAPPVVGAVAAVQAKAAAKLNLRVPPGEDPAQMRDALIAHLHAVAPWGVKVETEAGELGYPFSSDTTTRSFKLLEQALTDAYDGVETVSAGEGGSIPLTTTLAGINPSADIVLLGVPDPESRIHSTNESVHPEEIRRIALGEALFLSRVAQA
ncbi:M20/M25/M40 family metallo-hydrolase [Leucobacter sp. UT-8R-CII-1-4]|uniref:M20/M25/M40 family metallo-hydrolase n=1 Tax=Leucobacter sp. UT-8R-CII-1-4 TaxID=3040075 RepID=UPI0024A82D57|nr:M20/M25/M40 family metallo-hydrolase [Leucobacter sp. UT-8R-CII-1-4]MDI6022749.1 M20/M25/M40 family metallo-hydrolase [Leucobacter sp. UT-8R-CII-1-4]